VPRVDGPLPELMEAKRRGSSVCPAEGWICGSAGMAEDRRKVTEPTNGRCSWSRSVKVTVGNSFLRNVCELVLNQRVSRPRNYTEPEGVMSQRTSRPRTFTGSEGGTSQNLYWTRGRHVLEFNTGQVCIPVSFMIRTVACLQYEANQGK
jgi:hypothetical protein